jgi:mono/diheme cytochrome c family protein
MRSLRRCLPVAGLVLAALVAAGPAPAQQAAPTDQATRGGYLALAADCMPCHTAPGGQPFAGGRALNTPFGTLSSPNITPDLETGIGRWSPEAFYRALHEGIRADGADLYPVMPYTSYTLISRADSDAIFAFLKTLAPVHAPRPANGLAFPFDIRATLGFWRELYFRPREFTPDPAKSAQWNRGAYLGTALGHCGECHTPRNLLGAMDSSRSLRGAVIDGWFAPDIDPKDPRSALAGWSVSQIADWLRKGGSATKGSVFGPMGEVVHDSLSRLTDDDLTALATWLSDSQAPPPPIAVPPESREAATLYATNCSGCHQPLGRGIPGAIPPLAGNPAVQAADPNNVIQAVLNGIPAQGSYGAMPSFAAALTDAEIATLANYVRTAWTPAGGAAATPAMVAGLRRADPLSGASTEAARQLCPAIGPFGTQPGLPALPAGAFALMRGANTADLANRADVLLADLRSANPGTDDAALIDALMTAYCPAVANDPTYPSEAARRAQLDRFRAAMTNAMAQPPISAVDVTVPLPPDDLARAQAAARAAQMPLSAWLARAAREAAGTAR